MAQVELIMPKMGESVAEATITSWLKEVGDTIDADIDLGFQTVIITSR